MKLTRAEHLRDMLWLSALALVSYLPFLGHAPLFDWDEINFAESAREMIVTGNYFQVQVNFEPFWEKPPLFIWMQVLSMKIFGINEFAARLPNALVGLATLLSLYIHGVSLRGTRFAQIWVGFYFVSLLPFVYFKSGIIDPTFNLFIFLGLGQILRYESAESGQRPPAAPFLAGIWIGLATLTKGPVAILVSALVYGIWKLIWDRKRWPWKALLQFVGVLIAVILSWFGSLILLAPDGLATVQKFIIYQAQLFSQVVAGHEQPFFYHFFVFLLGCFPMSAFAFRGMGMRDLETQDIWFKRLMLVWFWVVLVLFSIVRTKIVHYSSMLYFPGSALAALYFERLWAQRAALRWDSWAILGLGVLLFGGLTLGVNLVADSVPSLQASATNAFMRESLLAEVAWTGWEFLPGLLILIGVGVGFYFLIRRHYRGFLIALAITTPIFLNGLNLLVLPRIADYSQNAAITFFQQKAKEDCYILVQGYKSYAQYFYGQMRPYTQGFAPYKDREDWLCNGPVDKDVYLVLRADTATPEMIGWFGRFTRIGTKNGFLFFERKAPSPTS